MTKHFFNRHLPQGRFTQNRTHFPKSLLILPGLPFSDWHEQFVSNDLLEMEHELALEGEAPSGKSRVNRGIIILRM